MFIFTFTEMYDESEDSQDSYSGYVKNHYNYMRVVTNAKEGLCNQNKNWNKVNNYLPLPLN